MNTKVQVYSDAFFAFVCARIHACTQKPHTYLHTHIGIHITVRDGCTKIYFISSNCPARTTSDANELRPRYTQHIRTYRRICKSIFGTHTRALLTDGRASLYLFQALYVSSGRVVVGFSRPFKSQTYMCMGMYVCVRVC